MGGNGSTRDQLLSGVRNAVPGAVRRRVGRLLHRPTRPSPPQSSHWCRIVMNRRVDEFISSLGPETLSAVEISADLQAGYPWRHYRTLSFPEFDLCHPTPVGETFDVVICEQVLEHVTDPWRACQTLHDLCRPGGWVIVSTPFLIKLHKAPEDYWRFTPDAMRLLLEHAKLEVVTLDRWGNRACARVNFRWWAPYRRWHSLRDEPDFPLVVWAFARRAQEATATSAGLSTG